MRIYQVNIEHKQLGLNFRSIKVAAKSFRAALAAVSLGENELIESVELLATTE